MSETTETDQIERDLARTRARMDNRLDELQDRLSPGQLVNDAFAYFKGGDGADFTRRSYRSSRPIRCRLFSPASGLPGSWRRVAANQRPRAGALTNRT